MSLINKIPVKNLSKAEDSFHLENQKIITSISNIARIFTSYISWCYYFGILPFKFVFDKETALWKIKGSRTHKVFK